MDERQAVDNLRDIVRRHSESAYATPTSTTDWWLAQIFAVLVGIAALVVAEADDALAD